MDRNNQLRKILAMLDKVALLAEGVDRNYYPVFANLGEQVALLAEGVDRNSQICEWAMAQDIVALLAEGVDRNYNAKAVEVSTPSHPPCRGYR